MRAEGGVIRLVLAALATIVVVGGLIGGVFLSSRPRSTPATAPAASSPTTSTPDVTAPTTPPRPTAPTASPASIEPSQSPGDQPGQETRQSAPAHILACDGVGLAAPSSVGFDQSVALVAQQYGAVVSVSWLDPDRGIVSAGELIDSPAWSTSKVPLALAVIKAGNGDGYQATISAALRWSDNDSAALLWLSLGADDQTRAHQVTSILRQVGDEVTTVPSNQLYPPYSIFGQTQWATSNQVQFAMGLPCLAGADQVIADMGQVAASQRWGMGRLNGAVFKGGWGPGPYGGYLVRQFGWYTDASGMRVPLAISAHAGSFDAGVATLDALVGQLG